eukprot:TRINITY_DN37729_c0_g1_i1.p1 TRINITY_DN37729_c0_g1~~TRINITY_DN37729_c0_g1_i1.p1  ORF type:complete len:284 (+),score=46.72 TRINITY_DN37729_c0_g1_i1:107-853(+)
MECNATETAFLSRTLPFFFIAPHRSSIHRIRRVSIKADNNGALSMTMSSSSSPSSSSSSSPKIEFSSTSGNEISEEEWRAWGPNSSVPAMVEKTIQDLNLLERELDIKMSFHAPRGQLKGQGRIEEEKKHRGAYKSLDSEQKLEFFTARQVAYRLLGSRGYLCQDCWLPIMDCMCPELMQQSLWQGIRFWVYMHPKDFLRKNNTGKLLWQVFGEKAVQLCIFGIHEHEEAMWSAFKEAGTKDVEDLIQ